MRKIKKMIVLPKLSSGKTKLLSGLYDLDVKLSSRLVYQEELIGRGGGGNSSFTVC